jgi:hypothetical protein
MQIIHPAGRILPDDGRSDSILDGIKRLVRIPPSV